MDGCIVHRPEGNPDHRSRSYLVRNSPQSLPRSLSGYSDGNELGDLLRYGPSHLAGNPIRNSPRHLRCYEARRPPDCAEGLVLGLRGQSLGAVWLRHRRSEHRMCPGHRRNERCGMVPVFRPPSLCYTQLKAQPVKRTFTRDPSIGGAQRTVGTSRATLLRRFPWGQRTGVCLGGSLRGRDRLRLRSRH